MTTFGSISYDRVFSAGNGNSWIYSGSGIFSRGDVLAFAYNPSYVPRDVLMVSKMPLLTNNSDSDIGSNMFMNDFARESITLVLNLHSGKFESLSTKDSEYHHYQVEDDVMAVGDPEWIPWNGKGSALMMLKVLVC